MRTIAEILAADAKGLGSLLPVPEAQIATLREAFERYQAECPFKPGDIVTPLPGSFVHGAGVPHIVLSVGPCPVAETFHSDPSNTGGTAFGRRLDMRIATHNERTGDLVAHWVESWLFQPYAAG